jgi:hypothetical protein
MPASELDDLDDFLVDAARDLELLIQQEENSRSTATVCIRTIPESNLD